MKKEFLRETNLEYQEFLSADQVEPPTQVSSRILERVNRDLNPSAWKVFAKISVIHLGVGIVTLALCPQFGIRTVGEGLGVMKYFMALGHIGCMIACGAFFVGSSLVVGALLLKPEEVRKLKERKVLQLVAVTLLSLGAFIMADAEILLGFAVAWFFGSVAGGIAGLELGWSLKKKLSY